MVRFRVRRERAVLTFAILVLPWIALSRIGGWPTPPAPSSSATRAFEVLATRAVVGSERLSFSFQGRRADGTRHVSTAPARILTSPQPQLAASVWLWTRITCGEPVMLDLACRGPPSAFAT